MLYPLSHLTYLKLVVVISEPSDRPCRLYYIKTFGEPEEWAWVEGRATHSFQGGFQFEQLPLLRRRGKQREENYKYSVIT